MEFTTRFAGVHGVTEKEKPKKRLHELGPEARPCYLFVSFVCPAATSCNVAYWEERRKEDTDVRLFGRFFSRKTQDGQTGPRLVMIGGVFMHKQEKSMTWTHKLIICVTMLLFSTRLMAEPVLGEKWKAFFPDGSKLTPVPALAPDDQAFHVADKEGKLLGWTFRTDKMIPAVKGKRDQIAVLVGLSTNGTVIGVMFLEGKEDKGWFDRIKDAFYAQFKGKIIDKKAFDKLDTVTGATVSSGAIIKDVYLSSKELLTKLGRFEAPPQQGEQKNEKKP